MRPPFTEQSDVKGLAECAPHPGKPGCSDRSGVQWDARDGRNGWGDDWVRGQFAQQPTHPGAQLNGAVG